MDPGEEGSSLMRLCSGSRQRGGFSSRELRCGWWVNSEWKCKQEDGFHRFPKLLMFDMWAQDNAFSSFQRRKKNKNKKSLADNQNTDVGSGSAGTRFNLGVAQKLNYVLTPTSMCGDNSVRWLLQNGALFFSTRQASMAQKSPHSHKVQALYDLCRKTFTSTGTPPLSSHSVKKLCSLLDTIGPADVGLPEDALDDDRGHGFFGLNRLDRVPRWAQPITYVDIHECESFTMCIFCFPTSAVMPLHDHPDMTVFSKVLYGSLHVKAYDWVEPARILNKGRPVRLAKLAVDKVLTAPCTTSVLYPKTSGNLHCFTAITPCAVLDILSPPYKEDAGRRCTFYHDYPYFTFSNEDEKSDEEENYAWLAETGTPDDLYMRSSKYNGPSIQV